MGELYDVLMQIIVGYSFFLMVFGFFANAICLAVCLRKNMRSIPTFVFYAFALASNTISLYFWNLDHYYVYEFNYLLEETSLDLCRTITFFQLFSFQTGAWFLTAMTTERYMCTVVKTWRSSVFKTKQALFTSVAIGLALFIINIAFVIKIDRTNMSDPNFNISCYFTEGYTMWMQEQNYMFCFIPFSVMLITNCLLVYRISAGKKAAKTQTSDKSTRTTLTVLLVTSLFLVFAGPSAIINAFFLDDMFQIDYGLVILFSSDVFIFTFNSGNFFILYFSNKQFEREVKNLMLTVFKRKNQVVDSQFTTTRTKIDTRHDGTSVMNTQKP